MGYGRAFERAYSRLKEIEGGLSDHPSDSGGETAYGWTYDTAKDAGWKGLKSKFLKEFTIEDSEKLLFSYYWERLMLQKVAESCENVSFQILDFAFHAGEEKSIKAFQTGLNLFNRKQKDYEDIKVDGIIGKKTIGAYDGLVKTRSQATTGKLLTAFITVEHGHHLNTVSEKWEKNEDFMVGWYLKRIIEN